VSFHFFLVSATCAPVLFFCAANVVHAVDHSGGGEKAQGLCGGTAVVVAVMCGVVREGLLCV
jgi:hypothetical protein